MAARAKTSAAKTTATRRKTAPKSAVNAPKTPKKRTLAELNEECEQLKAKLNASEARVAELEGALEQSINQIEWTIDLLQSTKTDTS